MVKKFTGASAYIDTVAVEDGEVRITAVAGATRATRVAEIYDGVDVEALVAAEVEAAMVLAETVDAGVCKGTAATSVSAEKEESEGLREGPIVGSDPTREIGRLVKIADEAHARAHEAEVLLEKSRRRVAILERAASAEFEWEGQIDVGTDPGSPVPVRVRSTEAGILALEKGVQRMREMIASRDEAVEAVFSGFDAKAAMDGRPVPVTVTFAPAGRTADLVSDRDTVDNFSKAFSSALRRRLSRPH